MLHQVGVSFDLYCDARKHKIKKKTDHILYDCELVKQERDELKAEILRSENWPLSKDTLINKYTKSFKKFVDSIPLAKLQSIK